MTASVIVDIDNASLRDRVPPPEALAPFQDEIPPMNRIAALHFDPRLTPARPDLADERLRGRVQAERYSAGSLMRVVAASAPLRREPRPDAPLDTEALMGEAVTVYGEAEGWAWGQLPGDGYVGYIPSDALD